MAGCPPPAQQQRYVYCHQLFGCGCYKQVSLYSDLRWGNNPEVMCVIWDILGSQNRSSLALWAL